MIGNFDIVVLQQIWWIICSIVGALFLFLTFVQGGQTLLWQVAKDETEKSLVVNSLGRKWELTFTTLVLFGGASWTGTGVAECRAVDRVCLAPPSGGQRAGISRRVLRLWPYA